MADTEAPPTYEELALIEEEFEKIDTEIIRKQYALSAPTYAKRKALTSRIPNFWALVFEQAPPEISPWIQVADSQVFADALTGLEVRRFEIDGPQSNGDAKGGQEGNPRSFSITMTFKPNEWFDDAALEKKFWYRRAPDGWTGLVSEPVPIHWKKGKDLTRGVTDLAVELFEARTKGGDYSSKTVPEYEKFVKKLDSWQQSSFFGWFAFVSTRRYVSAEESAQANKEEEERREKRSKGEEVQNPDEDAEADDECAEVLGQSEEMAICIAEDMWPSASKYFMQAQEDPDEDMSDVGFEDEDAEAGAEDDDDEGKPVDIRALVGKGRKGEKSASPTPPKKKLKS